MTGVVAKPDKKVHPKSYGADRKDQGGGAGLVPARPSRRRAVLLADGGVETRGGREGLVTGAHGARLERGGPASRAPGDVAHT